MSAGADCSNAIRLQFDDTIDGFERKRGQSDGDNEADGEAKRPRVGVTDTKDNEEDRAEDTPAAWPAAPSQETSFEARTPKIARHPDEPTAEERRKHNITHCPYRSWCRACVLGRGKDRYHRRIDCRSNTVPRIAMAYMFFTSYGFANSLAEAEELIRKSEGQCKEVITVLVVKDCMFGAVWAYPVRGRGLEAAPELIDHILGDIDSSGFDKARLFVKNDQEPAIKEVQDELSRRRREMRAIGTAEENS